MKLEISKPAALKDWAYGAIKDEILSLRIAPGDQIHIDELASQMDVSRTPVREALLRLEGDGLVEAIPRVGFFVTEMSRRDLEELLELRIVLESYAVEKACKLLSGKDMEHLENLLSEAEESVEDGDLGKYLEVEIDFHELFIDRTDNRQLIRVMEELECLVHRERVLSTKSPENVDETLREHRRIIEAIRDQGAETAGEMMKRHLTAAKERLLALHGELYRGHADADSHSGDG